MKYNFIIIAIQSSLPRILYGTVLSFAVFSPAIASQAVGWWGGDWNCNIDGRPALMRWRVVDDSPTTCYETEEGSICQRSSGVSWKGSFSDNGAAWVDLTEPDEGNLGGLFFRHADGNQWYLGKPTGNKTVGWTTWNGQRYSLSCWK